MLNDRERTDILAKDIQETLSEEDLYLQLAEEASELAQACLKLARFKKGTNPTKNQNLDCGEVVYTQQVMEEFTDVLVSASVCGLKQDPNVFLYKILRWKRRLDDVSKK